jgi:hypothetical protein
MSDDTQEVAEYMRKSYMRRKARRDQVSQGKYDMVRINGGVPFQHGLYSVLPGVPGQCKHLHVALSKEPFYTVFGKECVVRYHIGNWASLEDLRDTDRRMGAISDVRDREEHRILTALITLLQDNECTELYLFD